MTKKYNVEYSDDWEGGVLISAEFNKSMEIIVEALKERDYDPYAQLFGYIQENNPLYITRYRQARELVQKLDKSTIKQYIVGIK